MEPRAVELFKGDSAAHLKITSPAIREAFNKVMGSVHGMILSAISSLGAEPMPVTMLTQSYRKWAFGSQEHKNIAAQLCRDVQYEYKSRHKIDLRIEGMEWRGVVPHVVLSGKDSHAGSAAPLLDRAQLTC